MNCVSKLRLEAYLRQLEKMGAKIWWPDPPELVLIAAASLYEGGKNQADIIGELVWEISICVEHFDRDGDRLKIKLYRCNVLGYGGRLIENNALEDEEDAYEWFESKLPYLEELLGE